MTRPTRPRRRTDRRGAALVFAVFLIFVFLAMVALVVDIGYLANSKSELQRATDSAAMAACWDFVEGLASGESDSQCMAAATTTAVDVCEDNRICKTAPTLLASDVDFGYLSDHEDRNITIDYTNTANANAVTVLAKRSNDVNGNVPFFFAKVFGFQGAEVQAQATAYVVRSVRGFEVPSDGSNLEILPLALDEETWLDMLNGEADDEYSWDESSGTVTSGEDDGILEVNLFPQDTGAPGNRGTVDIGSNNNSTNDIARQITDGVSESDLDHHGGTLELNDDGELDLNGDTGISAGVKDELASIIGEPRIIPIFREVNGPGNNAMYTIVRWAGIRILYVKLTGKMKNKRVIVQPAPIVSPGIIPSPDAGTSDYIYSPVILVR